MDNNDQFGGSPHGRCEAIKDEDRQYDTLQSKQRRTVGGILGVRFNESSVDAAERVIRERDEAQTEIKRLRAANQKVGRLLRRLLDWAGSLDCECHNYDDDSGCSACRIQRTMMLELRAHTQAENSCECSTREVGS